MPATGNIRERHCLHVEISPSEGKGRVQGFERAYDETYHKDATNGVFTGGMQARSIILPVIPRP